MLDVHTETEDFQKQVFEITNFQREILKTRSFNYIYLDFSEALSETMRLLLLGVKEIKVKKVPQDGNPKYIDGESA
ncbi:hypothetical protein D3C80_2030370 [compost metagenome]